jgi:cytochrome b6-f complex iron-sulfur subunit
MMKTTQPPPGGGQEVAKPVPQQKPATKESTEATAKAAKPAATRSSEAAPSTQASGERLKMRRRFVWTSIVGFLTINFLMFLRFFFPRTLFEPSTVFRIGTPGDFPPGVDERFKQLHRIWVVRQGDKLFVVYAKCTHLGCTPNWISTENKFKCPCHGSGYDPEGVNFEGPAPRPMDLAHVDLDAEGQIVVDTSRLFACPPGECTAQERTAQAGFHLRV